jgi:hypothetical protein
MGTRYFLGRGQNTGRTHELYDDPFDQVPLAKYKSQFNLENAHSGYQHDVLQQAPTPIASQGTLKGKRRN